MSEILTVNLSQNEDTLTLEFSEGYILPYANEKLLGGVKPLDKTPAMTSSVGVDQYGRLWTSGLPLVTSNNDGSYLKVVNGQWVVSPMIYAEGVAF